MRGRRGGEEEEEEEEQEEGGGGGRECFSTHTTLFVQDVGLLTFERQVYQCIVAQMIELSADISVRRTTNEWGTIIWQLGEVRAFCLVLARTTESIDLSISLSI